MEQYSKECLKVFLEEQDKLLNAHVLQTVKETKDFFEENMAVELNNLKEVREYMEESGMDVAGMTDEELKEQSEVFALPSGRFLVVSC